MADSIVTFLLGYVPSLLNDEANFLAGVEGRVKSLMMELNMINISLKESLGSDEMVKAVVGDIREAAYKAEDVIDMFILEVTVYRKRSPIGRMLHFPSHFMRIRNVGTKIVGINDTIKEINERKARYCSKGAEATVDVAEVETLHRHRRQVEELQRHRRQVEEDDVVGFVDDSTILVKQLTEGDRELHVISIIGMGGLGKTTLAKKVYNRIGVTSYFDRRAWVYVSQVFKAKDLLLEIFKQMQIPDELRRKLEGMCEDELKKELLECLKEERYLIVMDDIWTTEDWDAIKDAFPRSSKGSRILITSRKNEVALHVSHTQLPYCLSFLNEDESWELFIKKVFREIICPPELEIPGRKIAEGCRGLPLSIVVLAGILKNKEKTYNVWSRYVDHVTTFLTGYEDAWVCPKILLLSYTDLPIYLKPCFLYFGIFPEDIEIPARRLMQLWVAEGFIQVQHIDERNIEDVAEDYLEELIDRSLIQVASRGIDRRIKTCRIHDLLRDLCIRKGKEEKFLEVQSGNHYSTINSRRLSILGTDGSTREGMSSNPIISIYARSLFFFGNDGFSDKDTWTWVHKNFKLVRVLNFEILRIPAMPKSIAKLIHLRYLRMEFSNSLSGFPDCIGNLINLETLYVKGSLTDGSCLPNEIFRLKRLRNLYLSDRLPLPLIRKKRLSLPWDSKEALEKLEVLSIAFLLYDRQKQSFPVELDKFPNVRKLKIQFECCSVDVWHAPNVFPSLHGLIHLKILRIEDCFILPTDPMLFPPTITKLTLKNVELEVGRGCLTMLGKLPYLRILKLEGRGYRPNRDGRTQHDISIRVITDSFPRLHALKLNQMKIKEWKQEKGAMPSLVRLIIIDCNELTSPPELRSLTTLRDVEAIRSSGWAKMLRELQKEVGFKLLIEPPIPDSLTW